jgi:hypothetical protein
VIQVSLQPLFVTLLFVLTRYPGLLLPDAEDNPDFTIGRENTEPMLGMYFLT